MKTKIFFLAIMVSLSGVLAQQKNAMKLQTADESGFIEVDKAPALKSQLKLDYPKLAKLSGIQGTVYLKLLIDEKGNVAKAKIEQGVKDMLDESALKAAKKAKFSPAMLKNKPVKVWVVLPIAFKLDVDKKDSPIVSNGESNNDPGMDDYIQVEKFPEMIEAAKPVYPEEAKKNKITGKVYVRVLIDKAGTPTKAIVIRSDSELLNQPSVDAALKSKFTHATNKGEAIAVWIVLPYKYQLDDSEKK
jgi:TonB family protein